MNWKEKTLINTFYDPWEYHIVDDFLPDELFSFAKDYPLEKGAQRCFMNKHPKFYALKYWFDRKFSISNMTFRGEISKNLLHKPHSDDYLRKISIIVNISRSDDSIEGTYLYNEDLSFKKIIPWKNNRALIFTPIENITYHACQENIADEQERRVVVVSYVDKKSWKDKHQLWDA